MQYIKSKSALGIDKKKLKGSNLLRSLIKVGL